MRLALMREAKASELATAMDIGRTEAYRLLQRLVEQRLAQMTMDRPLRFSAYPLEHVLATMGDDARAREASLERARGDLAPLLEGLRAPARDEDAPTFRLVKGRPNVQAELRRLAVESRSSYVAILTDRTENAAAAQTTLAPLLLERAAEGVDVRVLSREAGEAPPSGIPPTPRFERRALQDARPLLVAIADGRELVALAVPDTSTRLRAESEVALVTSAPALVASHQALFDAWWPLARRIA